MSHPTTSPIDYTASLCRTTKLTTPREAQIRDCEAAANMMMQLASHFAEHYHPQLGGAISSAIGALRASASKCFTEAFETRYPPKAG